MVDGVEHPNRAATTFVKLSRHMRPRIVLMKHDAFPIRYFWILLFVQLLSLIRLIGNNTSLNLSSRCLVKAHNTGFLSNPPDREHDLL